MSYQLTSATSAIHRNTGLVQGSVANYTAFFWFRPDFNISLGKGCNAYERINGAGTAWTGIFGANTNQYDLDVSDGVTDVNTTPLTLVAGKWYPVAYVKNVNFHNSYISVIFKGSVTLNIAAITFTDMILGYDGFASTEGNGTYAYFREWTTNLSVFELQQEANSRVAVKTASLVTDCALKNNFLDATANHNDFAAVGTGTFLADDPIPAGAVVTDPIIINSLPYNAIIPSQPTNVEFVFSQWFKYTAVAGEVYIGGWLFGDLVNYKIDTVVYSDAGITPWPAINYISSQNLRFQMPVVPGNSYWFSAIPHSLTTSLDSGTPLTVDFVTGPNKTVPDGSIFINDDLEGFYAAIISSVPGDNYNVLKFKPFAITNGEQGGDRFSNGNILVIDDVAAKVLLYDKKLTQILDTGLVGSADGYLRSLSSGEAAYVSNGVLTVHRVDKNGLVGGTSWVLTGTIIFAMAPSNDETILYVSPVSTTNAPVKKWDLVNSVYLADLVTGVVGEINGNILVLSDGSILVMYFNHPSGSNVNVLRYSAAGTLLNTYPLGVTLQTLGGAIGSLSFDFTDPDNYFLARAHNIAFAGSTTLYRVKLIDGSITKQDHVRYDNGVYAAAPTATPIAKFGVSQCCPFFPISALTQFSGIYQITTTNNAVTPRRTNDTLWLDVVAKTTEIVKIPDPLGRTGLFGG